jgi:hypothetical protein
MSVSFSRLERLLYTQRVGSSILSPPTIPPDNLLTRFQAQLANQLQSQGGQRMWLDLLVASGIGLPTMVYGSVLFLNYMQ